MSTPAGILTDLASVVLLLRDQPDPQEEQSPAFKRFATDLSGADHVLKVTPTGFTWDEVPVAADRGDLIGLREQLRAHGLGEIRLPTGLLSSTLFSMVRILSAPSGSYGTFDHLVARMDAAGCGVIPVSPLVESGPSSSGAPADRGSREKVGDDGRIGAIGPDALTEAKVGMMHFATLQPHAMGPASEMVDRLKAAGGGAATTEALNQLIAAGELAVRQREWPELLRAAHGLLELEKKGRADAGRGYGIALRRLLPRSTLEQLARLTAQGNQKAEATALLRRMGADGTEVLLHALVNSEDMNERRAYFSALKEMTEGGELLVHMLSHDQWFVVRNVADLCGELGLESSVHTLAGLVNHDDERVRRAVAGALARIGGTAAAEPLRRALRDPAPSVRLEAAQRLDGRKNKGLAMSVALATEAESKADVQRAMYLALGRIASPEAIQALRKAAEPGGRLFRRKPVSVRLGAVQGLHAAGPSAINALKDLLQDEEREVREAVERALQTLWE